jgi:glycine cleavage system aminomethyltransferase T
VGKYILLGYLPSQHAVEGAQLLVEYFGDRFPVTVAVVGNTPLYDPGNTRLRR